MKLWQKETDSIGNGEKRFYCCLTTEEKRSDLMKSLYTKILTLLLGSVLAAVLLMGGAGIVNAGRVAEEDSGRIMNLICENKVQEINTWLLDIEQSVDTIYSFADYHLGDDAKLWSDEAYMDAYLQKVYELMENAIINTDCALSVYLRFNPELLTPVSGIFLVKSDDGSIHAEELTDISQYEPDDREHVGWYYEPIANGGPTWTEPYRNKNINEDMISYVIPIYRGDTVIGVLGMDIDLDLLKEKVRAISVYETGHAILACAEGDIIYSKEYPEGLKAEEFDEGLSELKEVLCADSEEAEDEIFSYYRYGMKIRLVHRYMVNGMTFAIEAPASEIDRTRNRLVVQCALILLGVSMVATLFGIRLTRKLTKPLMELTQAAEQIGKGNYDVAIRCESGDEVGVLARTLKEAIREQEQCMTHINRLAYMDNLTGLNNRHYMEQYCGEYENREAEDIGLIFSDLNGLKVVNDHEGHAAGDRLICNFAQIIKDSFQEEKCFRVSGDEFVIIVPGKPESVFLEMVKEFRACSIREGVPLAAIGCCWRAKTKNIEEMMTEAETNMYQDKEMFYRNFPQYRR